MIKDISEQEIASAAARRSAAMRRHVEGTCAVCGKPIEGIAKRRYCSNACSLKASRARRRARQDRPAGGAGEEEGRAGHA